MAAYWETKTLDEMSPSEWEGLCDGCGLCCVIRFEDEDTGEVIPTRVHCKLFDPEDIKVYMPEEDGEKTGVFKDQIATFKADTLEELVAKIYPDDTAAQQTALESIQRYNQLAKDGYDEDFHKPALEAAAE